MDESTTSVRQDEAWLAAGMRRAQTGDASAYAALLEELADRARRLARLLLRAERDVEDVAQEVLIAVHKARHTYDPARPFLPWFHAIARHRISDARRRRARVDLHEVADEQLVALAADEPHGAPHARAEEVRAALAALPERQRQVVRLLKLDGCSVREVADATGLGESNVKVIAHRAYAAMRKRLGASNENG